MYAKIRTEGRIQVLIETYEKVSSDVMKNRNSDEMIVKYSGDIEGQIRNHNQSVYIPINPSKIVLRSDDWDWERISDKDLERIFNWYKSEDFGSIMKFHNDNKLSEEFYCCDSYIPKITRIIKTAINDGRMEF